MAADARKKTTGGGRRQRAREPESERSAPRQGERRPAGGGGTVGGGMGSRRALVIGIDDYGGPPNDLPSCGNDADAIALLLQGTYGFTDVRTLRDADASAARVNETLEWLFANGQPADRLVLYFSGHGYTRLTEGTLEEYLVLHDALLDGRELVARAQGLPPGVLTVILDAGFSGAPEAFILESTGTTPEVEVARVKSWRPPPETAEQDEALGGGGSQRVTAFRRFGCSPTTSHAVIARVFAGAAFTAPGVLGGWAGGDEGGQLELDGLLISACQETESAVASTSRTDGLSAFTWSLLRAVERVGPMASVMEVLGATDATLKASGFSQTPLVLERPVPGDLRLRRFLTLEYAMAGGDVLAFLSDPRFWETVLATMVPHRHQPRTVSTPQEVRPMATMYQTPQSTYQAPFGGYQQGIGTTQQISPDEIQRIAPVLGPVLASVLPNVLAPIVSNLWAQQQQQRFNPAGGFGAFQSNYGITGAQVAPEEMQRLLPVLGPVLASVLPAIVPQIVSNIVAQHRSGLPGGGQQLGFGAQGAFGQPGYLGQTGYLGQSAGYGAPGMFGQTDFGHVISQSINEALRRFGGQSPTVGGMGGQI